MSTYLARLYFNIHLSVHTARGVTKNVHECNYHTKITNNIHIWGVAAGAGRATRGWNNWLRWVRLDMGLGGGVSGNLGLGVGNAFVVQHVL